MRKELITTFTQETARSSNYNRIKEKSLRAHTPLFPVTSFNSARVRYNEQPFFTLSTNRNNQSEVNGQSLFVKFLFLPFFIL